MVVHHKFTTNLPFHLEDVITTFAHRKPIARQGTFSSFLPLSDPGTPLLYMASCQNEAKKYHCLGIFFT